ncbi:hypothetical protein R8Z50_17660 [Longispora sp. K20-0274]|uniref:hypothetical protein n=1 Tax=Longispora sp. K20-0274 TaxID=3088255 RepID=UPI00399BBFF5
MSWTVPPPPTRPSRGWMVPLGILAALIGHALTLVPLLLPTVDLNLVLIGQGLLFVLCMLVGILLIVKGDRMLGTGILIGWAVGVIAFPVIGVGLCIAVLGKGGM